ncbi:Tyrosine-protein phosphatase 69D [Lucilia cuprina]|nr:Tyrosine-protein phosphatase 69D [Lucilia cuprina]
MGVSLNYSVANDNDGNMGTNLTDEASQILSTKKSSNFKVLNGNGENYGSTASNERVGYKGAYDVYDGEIDMNSNYTGYLEVIVRNETSVLRAYSNYFEVITPGISEEQLFIQDDVAAILNIVILFLAILIGIVLVFSLILCFVYRVNTKNTGSTEEVISLRDSLSRVLFGGRSNNHRHFIGTANGKVADIGPIHKSDLYMAYKNRHKDTDYGFLREYEMLPNRFSDRTTKNSDLKENGPKNRYPDIKAYDQTRVKLSQINGIHGSDYINANFVIGYKERKKFICAQGPMDSTINDFWRMIWEQHLEIIVMLTNLEEYNKTKCSKYWPEKIMDVKQYGDITVKFVSEKKNGDYLVRSLDIYKRNSVNEEEEESRQITQYHYLVWKDFMAPEHPQALIKFIRHINAVYSVQRGPILVHCSAGVGRTGTLVALDSLLQQLEEESQVSIFNTVCDLRHQRNFLVQSLKQYIFLYRALLDTAHLGITEINAVGLSSAIENLKSKAEDGREKCKLEIEFEKDVLMECLEQFGLGNEGTVDEMRGRLRSYMDKGDLPPDHELVLQELRVKYDSSSEKELKIPPSRFSRSSSPLRVTGNIEHNVLSDSEVCDKIRKWGVKYDGGKDPLCFLERIEELAACYAIPQNALLNYMPELFKGDALSWYRSNKNNWKSYLDFVDDFKLFFLPVRFFDTLDDEIRNRVQRVGENFVDYVTALQSLMRWSNLSYQDQLERIFRNSRAEYKVYIKMREFSKLQELIIMAKDYESIRSEETSQTNVVCNVQIAVANNNRNFKLQTINDETNKSCSVGSSEHNLLKNRSELVILSPLPHKENSTYINASFIEGYDNSENFIITQDPLENTIEDFWRMVSEQSITTIVMLSEIGEGTRRCPRYWADDEIQFEHILVKYMQSESCPYYTRREFNVTNCKINDTIHVTQFQYNGWPTVEGEVPEVCRGIIELVDQALSHHSKEKNVGCKSPLTVHCSFGTDRSSIFVAMCILVQQLRTEKCVDICTTTRKIRSQRSRLIDTYITYIHNKQVTKGQLSVKFYIRHLNTISYFFKYL